MTHDIPKRGIKVWAKVNEKTSYTGMSIFDRIRGNSGTLGPTTRIWIERISIVTAWFGTEIYFWSQALEKRTDAFLSNQIFEDFGTADLRLEILLLYSRLDDIKGCCDCDGCDSSTDWLMNVRPYPVRSNVSHTAQKFWNQVALL